jgi:hypothetical protein
MIGLFAAGMGSSYLLPQSLADFDVTHVLRIYLLLLPVQAGTLLILWWLGKLPMPFIRR